MNSLNYIYSYKTNACINLSRSDFENLAIQCKSKFDRVEANDHILYLRDISKKNIITKFFLKKMEKLYSKEICHRMIYILIVIFFRRN